MSPDEFIKVYGNRSVAAGLVEPIVADDLSPGRCAMSLDLFRVTPNKRGMGTATRVLRLITQLSDESGRLVFLVVVIVDNKPGHSRRFSGPKRLHKSGV
jgi:hypothetical protein